MSLRRCPPPAPRMHHHTHTRTKALACMSHALCSCDKCCALKVPSQLHIRKQRMSITNDASTWASGLVETHHTALVMFMHGDACSFMRRLFLPLFVHLLRMLFCGPWRYFLVMCVHGDAGFFMRRIFWPLFVHLLRMEILWALALFFVHRYVHFCLRM